MTVSLIKKALILLILSAPIYILYLILSQMTNIPFWDTYNVPLSILMAIKNHYFHWSMLIIPEQTHRLLVPRLIFIASYYICSGNVLFRSFIIFGALIGAIILISYHLNDIKVSKNSILGLILLSSFTWLFLLPQANQYWYWAFITMYPLAILFFILALNTLKTNMNLKGFVALLVFSYLASYSCANGLLVWITAFMGMVLIKCDRRLTLTYGLIGLITIILYLHGTGTSPLPAPLYIRVLYALSFLGNLFFYQQNLILTIVMGSLGLLIYLSFLISCLKNENLKKSYLFWLLLPGISIGSAILGSIGRIWGQGLISITPSVSSRYLVLSSPLWCSCVVILLTYYWRPKLKTLAAGFFCTIVIAYTLTAIYVPEPDPLFFNVVDNIKTEAMALRNNYYIINTAQTNTSLWPYYNLRSMVLTPLEFLKQQHYNLFKEPTWDIIGQSSSQLKLNLSPQKFNGSFDSVNQSVPSNYNILDYSFLPGLESFGTVPDNKNIEMIYIMGPQNTVYGLAIPEFHTRGQGGSPSYILWHGFVAANLLCQQTKVQAYVKLKNDATLYPIGNSQVLDHSSMCNSQLILKDRNT
jgi:hypothetical protein